MISSYVKKQLVVFVILALSAALIIVFAFAKIPRELGYGQMTVSAYFTGGGGAYVNSNVTARGVVIGTVTAINLTPRGTVKIDMSVSEDVDISSDARAEIHSVSAVGEIYVDLISSRSEGPYLTDGSEIPIERTSVPVEITTVLDEATAFLDSIPEAGLRTFLDEGAKAFEGLGPDLRLLVDSTQALVRTADENYAQTVQLINTIGPLLDTQTVDGGSAVKAYFRDLASFTGAFRETDESFRGAIDSVADAADGVTELLERNENSTPILTEHLTTIGELFGIYRDGLEQVFVQYPIALAREQRMVRGPGRGLRVSIVNDIWPGCTEGFKGKDLRNPNDLTDKDATANTFCKIPHDAQRYVRGARNIPCQEGMVGERRATVAACLGKRPNQTPGTSGDPEFERPDYREPWQPQRTPLNPENNQRDYQHELPGGEPMAPFGATSTPAPTEEKTWQSLLTAPLES